MDSLRSFHLTILNRGFCLLMGSNNISSGDQSVGTCNYTFITRKKRMKQCRKWWRRRPWRSSSSTTVKYSLSPAFRGARGYREMFRGWRSWVRMDLQISVYTSIFTSRAGFLGSFYILHFPKGFAWRKSLIMNITGSYPLHRISAKCSYDYNWWISD